jgi:double-strand break repair protein MRE11
MGKSDLPANDNDDQSTGLAVNPVLLRKGRTRLGLYGIGNIKDARMHYELRSNRVRMFMPHDKDDWFNILLVHQNRWAYLHILLMVSFIPNFPGLSTAPSNQFQKACSMIA